MKLHHFKNYEIVKILKNIAEFLEAEGVPFKPRAYEKAALAIEALDDEVFEFYQKGGEAALDEIPGVGKGIAKRLIELFRTGKIKDYERLKKKYPIAIEELTTIEGLGAKTAIKLYKKLKIKTIKDLEKAARAGKIRRLPGFGEKSEQKILKGIEFLKKSGGRAILGFALPLIREIETRLKSLKEVKALTVCGSVRRMKETIGDIDILVVSQKPERVMDFFMKMPEVSYVYSQGPTKTMVRLNLGIDADLRVVPPESYGAAVQYFTGNKAHNIALREIAIKKGYKLNEYGLFKGKKKIAGKSEEEIYKALGLQWMAPELRTNSGEIEAAQKGNLPKIIGYQDLKGDLQVQTNWTDGANSIEEMARAAQKQGLEYIVITDHTKTLAMTGGLDERKIKAQWREIDRLNKKIGKGFKILKGAEVNILPDGRLDINNKVLSQLEVVGAAVHSHFNLKRKDQTERIKKAMQNPHVDIIFHPTGRVINRRAPYEVDIKKLIQAAKKTGTILEIDAYPDRLDLKDEHIRQAVAAGVKLAIDSDAHSITHFGYLELGIAQARRGWATKKDIINTWPLKKMLSFLKNATSHP